MKGCQKNVIMVKGRESELFEEAYFIMRETENLPQMQDIVKEAERIIDNHGLATSPVSVKLNRRKKLKYFFVGIGLACVLWAGAIYIFLK